MPQPNDLSRSLAALDQDSTRISSSWARRAGWSVAGIERHPLKKLAPDAVRIRAPAPTLTATNLLCSAIDPIERLIEHVRVPGAVPCLDIGLELPEQIGARPLLGREALGAECAHLAVETFHVDRARLVILDHDFTPDDDCGDIRAHCAFHEGVDEVEFRVDPGIARHPVEVNENRVTLSARYQRADFVRKAGCLAA